VPDLYLLKKCEELLSWHVAGPGVDNLVLIQFHDLDVLVGYFCSSQSERTVFIFLQYKFSIQWLIELCRDNSW
jgi:hypothetical protein